MKLRGEIEAVKARPEVVRHTERKRGHDLRHLVLRVGGLTFDGMRIEFHLADAEAVIRELEDGVIWMKQGDSDA